MATELQVAAVLFTVTTFSLLCGLTTLWLIVVANRWNGYVCIIFFMSSCQILFDLSFYLLALAISYPDTSWLTVLYILFSVLGGLSTAIWTNIISTITLYVCVSLNAFSIYKHFNKFLFLTSVPALIIALGTEGNSRVCVIYSFF